MAEVKTDSEKAFSNEKQKTIRLGHLKNCFDVYTTIHGSIIKYAPQAPNTLNQAYWAIMDSNVKKYFAENGMTTRVDRHKIVSTLEFAVVGVKPIDVPGEDDRIVLKANVAFACFLAWHFYRVFFWDQFKIKPANYDLTKFFEEHAKFLEMSDFTYKKGQLNSTHKTLSNLIFSNAATWFGIDKYVKAMNGKI